MLSNEARAVAVAKQVRRLARREEGRAERQRVRLHQRVQPAMAVVTASPKWFSELCALAIALWRAERQIKQRRLP